MTETSRRDRPLALVTGASSGIGRELARELAGRGFDLVVCAEDAELDDAARAFEESGAEVAPVRTDLRRPEGVDQVWSAVEAGGRPLAAAALNAGVGQGGPFVGTDLVEDRSIIDLNITSTVHLAKLVLTDMVARGEGRVLITSSVAATTPGTYQAVYNASKSFLQSFALAVRAELRDTGVTVTSLMPGPTETEFFERADMTDTRVGAGEKDDPVQVARQGVEAMLDGREKVLAGSLSTRATGAATAVLPDSVKAAVHGRMAKPGSAG
ncbi:SDR family NAD(P)-dependent oxidoreductase [Pseudonocardia sp. C8]|uniref:SDR family NAD(P)-dependent oxidoreductase n=1 Tax=Pseudonocardia sp. C8 TaxID=2762759 RepID=UPI0016427FC6|nr:SDR family NAD(P)-dependent oxidoreductase [Pseudonocardia sp. C8]MBC3191068.1 SDR family NAD(P)-dependent oxidoreductase [Pseudonocardia sp. C8]